VDLAAVASGGDSGVPHGEALTRFTEAVVRGTDDVEPARAALAAALGDAAVVEAAAVVGTFQMMDRIADSTGIPLDAPIQMLSRDVREQMGLDAFGSASNTPAASLLRRAGGRALSSILRTGIRLRGRLRR
jgi:hypothetical protein